MTWVIKTRGTPTASTIADYWCDDHHRFELAVDRINGDAPDSARCPVCGNESMWCISAPLARVNPIEAIKGKSQRPERATWTDTRAIGEGQPLYDWKEDRAKIWEEKRKQDVVDFARMHNERVIGGD